MKMSPMSEISSISSTSTTAQRRKIKKPLIEKRRRLRINQSLANLKSLVLEATKKDENCFPKMEKADILEMTVAYMKTTSRCLPTATSCPPSLDSDDQMRTYLSGFQECAMQVCSFLMDESALSVGGAELCGQLSRHLSGCFHRLELDRRQNQGGGDDGGWPRRRRTASSFLRSSSDSSGAERSAKERKISSDEDPSYSSSSSSSSSEKSLSPPVGLPLLSPHSVSSPTNFKTDVPPRNAAGVPLFIPSSVPLCSHASSKDCIAAAAGKTTSQSTTTLQAFNSRTRLASNHSSSVPLLTGPGSSLVQQHPSSCRSPMKGDDFPMANAAILPSSSSSSSSMPVAVGIPKSTLSPYDHHYVRREVLPAVELHSSIVWRPW